MSSTKTPRIDLFQMFDKKQIHEAIDLLHDAFIRDEISEELDHEKKIMVHDILRGFEYLVEKQS